MLTFANIACYQILFAMFIGSALAAPSGVHLSAPLLASAPVLAHAQTVTAVHHPAQINTHLAPAAIAVQTPTLSGYSYTSEVRHDAPALIAAAPIVQAAPIVHAAPVVHAAAPLLAPVAPLLSKSYSVETGRLVSGTSYAVAPALSPIVSHHAPLISHHAAPLLSHHSANIISHHGALVAGHAVAAAPLVHAAPVVAHAPLLAAHAPVLAAHAPLLSAWKKA